MQSSSSSSSTSSARSGRRGCSSRLSQLLIIGGVSGLVLSSDTLRTDDAVPGALAHAGLASLFTLVLGITAVAGEYRNKTITDTFLSVPRRSRAIGAKLAAYAAAGAVFAVVNAVTALVATKVWWLAKDVPLDLGGPDVWSTIAGCAGWNVAFAVIGVGIGALVRNLTAAVAAALVWVALVEGIVGQLVGDFARGCRSPPARRSATFPAGPVTSARCPSSRGSGAHVVRSSVRARGDRHHVRRDVT